MRCATGSASPFLILLLAMLTSLHAQDPSGIGAISWQHGPNLSQLGEQAYINVPEGFVFADANGAKRFMELTENIPSGRELGVLAHDGFDWFVVFEFDETGYVRDDEKASLDADAMLKTLQTNTERSNVERKRRGWGSLTVLDWIQPPHYDGVTHNLEWSMKLRDEEGNLVANYNTRYLGRRGVMRVSLVTDTDALASTLPHFRSVMEGFGYTPDNDYRAFVKGDKVAEYGLTALVVGGAAAAATKTGLLKYLWKLALVGIAAIAALLKKLFGRGRQESVQGS